MGEYGFDRRNDAGVDATAQMPGVDGYSGYSPGYGEENPAPAKTMVTRRRAVVTAILCSVFAFGVSAAYAESSKGNAGDKAMASRYETTKSELSATKAENDELKQKLEAANSAKAKAEYKAEGLQSQVGTLTSERDACKSDLAAKNGSSAPQTTQGQANGAPSGGSNAPSGTSSGRASSGQSGQSGQAGNGDSGYSAPAAPSHLPRAAGIPAQARPRRGRNRLREEVTLRAAGPSGSVCHRLPKRSAILRTFARNCVRGSSSTRLTRPKCVQRRLRTPSCLTA